MKKIESMWTLLWAKHYAVLTGDTQDEISWAIESLRKADREPQSITSKSKDKE